MKLIAESQYESNLLDGLSALLCDLGVDIDSYRHEEAIAVTFFSARQFAVADEIHYMSSEEQANFLYTIEDSIRASMLDAGYRTVERALRLGRAGISHPDRHQI